MANPEHLQILEQGVVAWNAWRHQHRDIRPDLSEADLLGQRLGMANLAQTNLAQTYLAEGILSGADLTESILTNAILTHVTLIEANLTLAHLGSADLGWANLVGANLVGANLIGADLALANLTRADLTRANVSEAHLFQTVFFNTNLTDVQGLETCHHAGPSILDHRTLALSGPLPLAFLRGCGLPEPLIKSLLSLLNDPAQLSSCFISYSSVDKAFCHLLYKRLQGAEVRVYFAEHNMQGGRKLHEQIDHAIKSHDKLLLVLSAHSMQSQWVEFEIRRACQREVTEQRQLLFPVRLVDYEAIKRWECFDADTAKDLATEIREYYIPDFTAWKDHDAFEAAVARLLRDLKAESRQPAASA